MTGPRQWKNLLVCICICSAILLYGSYSPNSVEAAATVHKRFVYNIYWLGIKAGKAVLEYTFSPEGTTISTHATSASFISIFYKVDDFAVSTTYPDGYPRSFILKVREGSHRRNKATYFDAKSKDRPLKIVFHNLLKKETDEFYPDKPVYDPLSAFYATTRRSLEVGRIEHIDVFDNKKFWDTEVQVLRKERIRVIAGEFDTIVIKPHVKSEGIFRKTGDIHIWLTDNDKKVPVLFKSKAIIGKFTVSLVEGDY